ncbi:outer membrane protein assembly factor BamB [Legionella sp. 16cNR16C]|uniref:outer membrane protein assembly factor BamB n=1 Tax=Legionella sp. 16cNR16C TaxID=2905656 RepID=UPI001E4DFA8F|nr:outer membrane protein assembly factor BamB [Legionella sp. 16cNR16C]MCE3043814.1 outer membrane protein assembly factor BamB [Legionella sp. 16cNR16C]
MFKKSLLLVVISALTACSTVDDYLLGKDNTPVPNELEPIKPKVALTEKWSVPVSRAKHSGNYLKLQPVIVGNTIYTADASGSVEAIDKKNGKILWSRKLDNVLVSGPSVGAGYIAVGTENSKVIVLKQADGSDGWQASVSGEVLSKPVIAQGKVLAKTIDGNLYAFNLASGEQLWVSDHGAPGLVLKASSSPVVVNNQTALVGYSDGKMDAVDIQTGHVIWQRSIAFASGASDVERLVDIDADPIVEGQTVILGSYQGYVGAFSLSDGQFIWRKPASIYKNMTVQGNTLYLTDSEDVVWAINKQNGQVNWKQVALKARGLTEPVISGDRLLIGDKTGMLHVLSAQSGEFISRAQVGSAIISTPSVSGKDVYVMTNNGKLSRFSVG